MCVHVRTSNKVAFLLLFCFLWVKKEIRGGDAENTGGCSNMMGVSGLHPGLWAYCEGAILLPALGGVVPGQWAQRALLWFQRSQLQPPALCSTASTHNTTKPNPEVKIRNFSSLLLFFFLNQKRGEGRKACPFDTDSVVMIREDRRRMENSSMFSSVSWQYSDDISATRTSSTQGFPLVLLIRNFRIFFNTKWETTFLILSCLPMTFPSAKIFHKSLPTDGNRRALLGPGHRVRAGAMLRKQQAVPRGEERVLSFRAAITKPPQQGWHPLSTVRGMRHSLAPQDTVNKKLLSLESQQDNDGRRLGLSNERNSPSEPCWATKPRGQKMETSNLVGWRKYKKKVNPQKH